MKKLRINRHICDKEMMKAKLFRASLTRQWGLSVKSYVYVLEVYLIVLYIKSIFYFWFLDQKYT